MFHNHLERLLNPSGEIIQTDLTDYRTSIPQLDKNIDVSEVKHVIEKQIKPNKSCCPDGINPGVLKLFV